MANQLSKVSYNSARFLKSAERLEQCPEDEGIEIAFAGRSNAGKSSALNAITNNGKLAKTSKTPGRTQLINFFTLNAPGCRLVDLPGYGYAKVSRSTLQSWQRHLQQYLEERRALAALVLIMDIRHPLSEFDQGMLNWCSSKDLPTLILLSKADKLKFGAAKNVLLDIQKKIAEWPVKSETILFSSPARQGVQEAHRFLSRYFLENELQE